MMVHANWWSTVSMPCFDLQLARLANKNTFEIFYTFCCFVLIDTRWGWCPRTGKGQQLMVKEAVSEYIWLATCQSKIYENKPPSARHETINF